MLPKSRCVLNLYLGAASPTEVRVSVAPGLRSLRVDSLRTQGSRVVSDVRKQFASILGIFTQRPIIPVNTRRVLALRRGITGKLRKHPSRFFGVRFLRVPASRRPT